MQIVMGLKDPWKFLFVDMDIAMVAICAGFGAMTASMPTLLALGFGVGIGYGMHAMRKGKARGYAKHFTYWYLPPLMNPLQRVPPAWSLRTLG